MCNESNFICLHSDQYNKCLDQNLNYNNLTNMFNSDMFNTNTFNTSWYKMNLNFNKCEDKNKYCESWSDMGECYINPSYMLNYCSKSCKLC
jgi:hypothetical protein